MADAKKGVARIPVPPRKQPKAEDSERKDAGRGEQHLVETESRGVHMLMSGAAQGKRIPDRSVDRVATGFFGDIAYSPTIDCVQLTRDEPARSTSHNFKFLCLLNQLLILTKLLLIRR